jgi:hypothetical protein
MIVVPQSPVTTPFMYSRYCVTSGWSRPRSERITSHCCWLTSGVLRTILHTSPGIIRTAVKTTMLITKRTTSEKRIRLTMYWVIECRDHLR